MTSLNIRTLVGYGRPAASWKKSAKIPVGEEKIHISDTTSLIRNPVKPPVPGQFCWIKRGRIYNLATNHLAEDLTTCAGTRVQVQVFLVLGWSIASICTIVPCFSQMSPYWATLHHTELCCILLSYSMLYPNWALLYPNWAMLHQSELSCTLRSYAAPYWATLHSNWATLFSKWARLYPTELCYTLTELRCTLIELSCSLLSYATLQSYTAP
jgi:hypothetical protein